MLDALREAHAAEVDALIAECEEGKRERKALVVQNQQFNDFAFESAKELRNLAFDARNDQATLGDIARSIQASRISRTAAVVKLGPQKTIVKLLENAATAQARIAEILSKAEFLQFSAANLKKAVMCETQSATQNYFETWPAYQKAQDDHARLRREKVAYYAKLDIQKMGDSIIALKRSRALQMVSALGLPAARELDKLYDIYCARKDESASS